MVSLSLPEGCEKSDDIIVDIPHNEVIKSFRKVKSISRQDNLLKGLGVVSPDVDFDYAYWYGEDSSDGSTFNYVQHSNGYITGSLVDLSNDVVMQIQVEDGIPVVTITDSSAFPPEVDPVDGEDVDNRRSLASKDSKKGGLRINSFSSQNKMSEKEGDSRRSLYDDNGGNIDVMVLWTKEAECRNNGQASNCSVSQTSYNAMMARVELAVEETNTAYDLSGVQTQLLLVHAYRHPTYVDEGFSASLSAIRSGSVSGVHSNRQTYGADVVALIIDDPQYCGIGYVGPSKAYMYSVTAWNCATGYYSFGHEIGHNFGLLHDRGSENKCDGLNYNYGYRDPQASFRSIMAYNCRNNQCDNISSNGCTRVMRFSNDQFLYQNKAMGTATEDSARKINDVKATVAGYYTHVPVSSPTVSPKSPSPSSSPSDAPSDAPSDVPSNAPVDAESDAPSNAPTADRCDIMNVMGQTIYVPGAGACWRIQLGKPGTLEGDMVGNDSCQKKESDWQSSTGIFSNFWRVDPNDDTVTFQAFSDGQWKGRFQFKEDPTATKPYLVPPLNIDQDNRKFELVVAIPTCSANAICPTMKVNLS